MTKRKRADGRAMLVRRPAQIRRAIEACDQKIMAHRERRRLLRRELVVAEARMTLVREMHEIGATYCEIGKRIGRSRQFVYQLLHPRPR